MKNIENSIKNNKTIGQNIKDIRKSLNLTQEKFAEQLNLNPQFVSQIENGKVGISIENAINICNIAGCSSSKLFNGLIKSSDIIDKYELLSEKNKFVIYNMINLLLDVE